MNAEWTLAAEPIDLTPDDAPQMPAALRRSLRRPLRRWAVGLVAVLAVFMAWAGVLLLIGSAVWQYTIPDMVAPIAALAAGQIVVVALVYAIAWRTGKLS